MCKWGTTTKVKFAKAKLKSRRKEGYVDSCIANIIRALNKVGIRTLASCCGHEHIPGNIILEDERVLIIFADWKEAKKYYEKMDLDIHGEKVSDKLKQEKS